MTIETTTSKISTVHKELRENGESYVIIDCSNQAIVNSHGQVVFKWRGDAITAEQAISALYEGMTKKDNSEYTVKLVASYNVGFMRGLYVYKIS